MRNSSALDSVRWAARGVGALIGFLGKHSPAGMSGACLVDSSGRHSMEDNVIFVRLVLWKPMPYACGDCCSSIRSKGLNLYFKGISFEIIINDY